MTEGRRAASDELLECWGLLRTAIKAYVLEDGRDNISQRNGLVMAANMIIRRHQSIYPEFSPDIAPIMESDEGQLYLPKTVLPALIQD